MSMVITLGLTVFAGEEKICELMLQDTAMATGDDDLGPVVVVAQSMTRELTETMSERAVQRLEQFLEAASRAPGK